MVDVYVGYDLVVVVECCYVDVLYGVCVDCCEFVDCVVVVDYEFCWFVFVFYVLWMVVD